ncbi:hypothetical protein C7B76_05865 [filamentous cyanobacterium CCP2]|nr:hypothetical protein C7B76_05865 [filamentous cyanobacterium CCP2]
MLILLPLGVTEINATDRQAGYFIGTVLTKLASNARCTGELRAKFFANDFSAPQFDYSLQT